jgi:hypothetical protein
MEPGAAEQLQRQGVLSCKLFFPFFPWLVVSLFADLERVLLLSG